MTTTAPPPRSGTAATQPRHLGTRLSDRLVRLAEAATTPLLPADYLDLVHPLRSGADLRGRIERRFGVHLHERTVGKLLHRLAFRRLSVRPRHPECDPAAQEAFRGASPRW